MRSQLAELIRFRSRGELRRRRRDRRIRQRPPKQLPELVKLTAEEKRRMEERKEYIDQAVAYLANYKWCFFITLTFRETQGAESIERAIKRFMRFIHENIFGEITDVRDLFGVRYFPAIERGSLGRLHAHLMICGGEILGELLAIAKWLPWKQWWRRNYGEWIKIEEPQSQNDVAAYCTKYMLKGEETGFELCSTWADERDRRARAQAPLTQERKIGVEVVRSAELERGAFRCESPRGTGPTSKGNGKPCPRCKLVSQCRCWKGSEMKCFCGRIAIGPVCSECHRCSECCACASRHGPVKVTYHNAKFGQVVDAPEPNAGACESGEQINKAANPSPLSPQLDLPLRGQQVLPLQQASASKSVILYFSSRREKYLQRRRAYELRRSHQVSVDTVGTVPRSN